MIDSPTSKICSRCQWDLPLAMFALSAKAKDGLQGWCRGCQAWNKERIKQIVLDHYGHECGCCGSIQDLSVDHIDGGGNEHRKEIKVNAGTDFYLWLIKNKFPKGYQILCTPCNSQKGGGAACTCGGTNNG